MNAQLVPVMGIKEALAFEVQYLHRPDCNCQRCVTEQIHLAGHLAQREPEAEDEFEYGRR